VEFSADGRLVFAISPEQRLVHVWDVHERAELFTLPLPREQAFGARDWHLAVSPVGQKLAISMDGAGGSASIYLFSGLPANPDKSPPKTEAATRTSESPPN